jgi:shikimate kinase
MKLCGIIKCSRGCNYWSWGGTPCYANNHELLKERLCFINLSKASIDTLFNRLVVNKSKTYLPAKVMLK